MSATVGDRSGTDNGVSRANLDALIRPSTVAVVGASDNAERIGGRPISYMRRFGFSGRIWGVNPKYDSVQGQPCVATVDELPDGIDLYVFATPAQPVPDMLEAACRRGARAATIFSGGFAEAGSEGVLLQKRLTALAREYGIALNGPNCLGVISFTYRNFATFSTALTSLDHHAQGPVAVVSQSGGFATNLCVEAALVGGAFSHVVTTGNEAGLAFSDYLEFLARDDSTSAVLGYLEGIEDGWRLATSLGRLRQAGKAVYLTKVGRTRAGAGVVATHTALASGADSSYDALFRRYGVTRLHTIDELVDVARAHSRQRHPEPGLVVATISGGTAAYIADACDALGVRLPELAPQTRAALADQVPDFAFTRNPVDITAQLVNNLPTLRKAVDTLSGDPQADRVLLFLGGQESQAAAITEELLLTRAHLANKLSVAWLGIPEDVRSSARRRGLDVHGDPIRFLRGVAATGAAFPTDTTVPAPPVDGSGAARSWLRHDDRVVGTVEADFVAHGGRRALDEWHTLRLVERAGVRTPDRCMVVDAEGVERAAEEVGFPCVLKLLRPFVAHRSAVGAVRTGIRSSRELRDAWMGLAATHHAISAVVEAQAPSGLELIVGVLGDPGFDARMVISAGGVDVDSVSRRITLLPPFDREPIRAEIAGLELWEYASLAGLDRADALDHAVDAAARIGELFVSLRSELDEIECNPVIVNGDGAMVVDALAFGKEKSSHE